MAFSSWTEMKLMDVNRMDGFDSEMQNDWGEWMKGISQI
jgi:hypothetical protein